MGIYKYARVIAVLTVIGGIVASTSLAAYAATLTTASLRLGNGQISQSTSYTLAASGFSTGTAIGCIEVDLGTAIDGTGAVTGLNTASSTFGSQSITASGAWTASNTASADHKLRLTNGTPVVPQTGAQTAVWNAVTNGSTANTAYYAVFTTYTSNTCATPVDTVTVQLIYTDGQATSVNVDGVLTFSVAGIAATGTVSGSTIDATTTSTTIPFGTATSGANKVAAQNLTVATNAGSGYTVYIRGGGTSNGVLTNSSGQTIDALATHTNAVPGAFSAAGTEAFGYTTEDALLATGTTNRFSTTNKWAALTSTNAEIIYNNAATATQTTKVGYQVGIASTTDPGAYTTTVIYTATPVY